MRLAASSIARASRSTSSSLISHAAVSGSAVSCSGCHEAAAPSLAFEACVRAAGSVASSPPLQQQLNQPPGGEHCHPMRSVLGSSRQNREVPSPVPGCDRKMRAPSRSTQEPGRQKQQVSLSSLSPARMCSCRRGPSRNQLGGGLSRATQAFSACGDARGPCLTTRLRRSQSQCSVPATPARAASLRLVALQIVHFCPTGRLVVLVRLAPKSCRAR